MRAHRITAVAVGLALVVTGFGGAPASSPASSPAPPSAAGTVSPPSSTTLPSGASEAVEHGGSVRSPLSPLATLVEPAGSLLDEPAGSVARAAPIALELAGIGVRSAPVRGVGVTAEGDMEIPGPDEIGWYRWSPIPGDEGSSVLAAHIAFDGRDGVFRRLATADVGDEVTIHYSDGSAREFRIAELATYRKEELPRERIFAKDGAPVLALITCGGEFDRDLRSYGSNVVAYAVPV